MMYAQSLFLVFWMFFLGFLTIIHSESVQTDKEINSFGRYLNTHYSSVEFLHKWPWILQGLVVKDYPVHKFYLELVYKTRSKEGKLFSIVAETPFKYKFFTLEAMFRRGVLHLKLVDEKNKTLIEQAKTSTKRSNDGHFHWVHLSINAEGSSISLNGHMYYISGKLFKAEEQHDLNMKLFLGAYEDSNPSIIGCVKVLNFGDFEHRVEDIPELISSHKVSHCLNDTEKQEKVFDLEDSSERLYNKADFLGYLLGKNKSEEFSPRPTNTTTILSFNNLSKFTKGPPTEVFCRPSEKTQCENHKQCLRIKNYANFTCVCKHGYAGRFCQFSLFARTCADAFQFHKEVNAGVYQLDMDGSGPLPMTFVECAKEKVDGLEHMFSIISHNFPNKTVVRSSKDKEAKFFPVTYKLFSPLQLKALIDRSEQCEQYIRYDCHSAPLNFHQNMTWLISATVENSAIRPTAEFLDMCNCRTSIQGCAHNSQAVGRHVNCNCDDPSAKSFDEGILFNENSAVSFIFIRRNKNEGNANLTLGKLKCRGEDGNNNEKTVTFKTKSSKLELAIDSSQTNEPLTQLEFDFKTTQKDIGTVVSGQSTEKTKLEVWWMALKLGYRLEFQVNTSDDSYLNVTGSTKLSKQSVSLSILSQTKLSDLKWHRVIIEVFREEIRFSVDNFNEFQQINSSTFTFTSLKNMKILIGNYHYSSGFAGCVRNFRVNNKLVDLVSSKTKGVTPGCPDKCAKNSCEQDSQCIHNFEDNHVSCECKNKHIHSGLRCEKNVNKNSEVSFHDSASGYLKYLNEHLPGNPLNTGLVFNVRTDQKSALLVYAHDQFNNFVQIHLSDEYQIVLTLNNNTNIQRCIVFSRHGKQFNDMRWLQIILQQTADQITLTVDEEVCEITGPQLLAQQKINAFTGNFEEVILPQQPAGPAVATTPYYFLFAGGLPSVQHDRTKTDRIAYYVTTIPGLLGCMRGLMVNGKSVDLRTSGIRPTDSEAVRIGCYNDCDTLLCHNAGHCSVQWQNYDPMNKELTGCDCSKTSYYGSNCLEDTGLTFTGNSSIVFDMSKPKRLFLRESTEQSLKFAFASAQTKDIQDQHLTTIYFSDGHKFQVILTKNGTLKVILNHSKGQLVGSEIAFTRYNYTDGYRHFFQARFSAKKPVWISLDADKQSLDKDIKLHLADSQLLFFGGEAMELSEEEEVEDKEGESSEEQEDLDQTNHMKKPFFSPDEMLIHRRKKKNVANKLVPLDRMLTNDSNNSNITDDKLKNTLWARKENNVARYQGCLSNVEIDFQKNEAVRFRPLIYYTQPKDVYHKSVRNDPRSSETLTQTICPSFRVIEVLPSQKKSVQFPVWEAPLFSFSFEDDQPVVHNVMETDRIASWWMWLNVLLLLLLILATLLCLICRIRSYRKKKKSKRNFNAHEVEGKLILRNASKKRLLTQEQPIDLLFISQKNGTENPKNKPPYPNNNPLLLLKKQPSMEKDTSPSISTFSNEKEEELDDYEDVDSMLANGFDEKLPTYLMEVLEQ